MVNETLSLNSRYEPGTTLFTAMAASPASTKGLLPNASVFASRTKRLAAVSN
jgi:hypothetical protein